MKVDIVSVELNMSYDPPRIVIDHPDFGTSGSVLNKGEWYKYLTFFFSKKDALLNIRTNNICRTILRKNIKIVWKPDQETIMKIYNIHRKEHEDVQN